MKINELKNHFNEEIIIKGFIEKIRDLQYVQFVIIRDITGKVQLTIEKEEKSKKLNDLISELTVESTVTIKGKILENEKVKLNQMEIIPSEIIVTSNAEKEIPIDLKDKNKTLRETRLDYRFLDLRRTENNLLFRCQTTILNAMRQYWVKNNFIEINTPKIINTASESGAEVFELNYFGKKAYLAQSPQFYKQMAMASGFEKVFEIGPVFRAEKSHTSYHASEITMVDSEISNIDSFEDVMNFEEEWITYFMNELYKKHKEEVLNTMKIELNKVDYKFPRITFEEAKKIIKEKFKYQGEKDYDLDRKEEELISKYVKKEYNSEFVFITKYPYEARPFYHMLDESNLTNSFDLIYKGVEITTGAQREHRIEILKKQAQEKSIPLKSIDFYLEFFKYGCPPHGGFGFGFSRLIMKIFEIDNIREATFLYRGENRITP